MKKIILTLLTVAMAATGAFAQDINEALESYNAGAAALDNGEKQTALEYFQNALQMCDALGDEAAELKEKCTGIIPQLHFSIGKDLVKAGQFDEAVAKLQEAANVADALGDFDVVADVANLIPQVYEKKAATALKSKDYASAIAAYTTALELEPGSTAALLGIGQAYEKAGDLAKAEESYKSLVGTNQEKKALKLLCNLYVKKAAASLKAKDNTKALEYAKEALTYGESDKAYRIAGQATMNLGDKQGAIDFFNKYLEAAPAANDAPAIREAVAALEKQLGAAKAAKEAAEDDF